MIMSMCKWVCVTNRKRMKDEVAFIERIRKLTHKTSTGLTDVPTPSFLILREKDLSEEEYFLLAQKVHRICQGNRIPLVLHSFSGTAEKLGIERIHMPLSKLLSMTEEEKSGFTEIGASVHSVKDAVLAEAHGATYLIAGHIFATDCKRGIPGRGLTFLSDVCRSVSIPVYAIGGIDRSNAESCIAQGASGVCMMSGYFS